MSSASSSPGRLPRRPVRQPGLGSLDHSPGRPPPLGQLLRRRIDPVLYTLSDMADDALGLMRALELEPAHVVGASMGGMIAQTLAAEHPEAVARSSRSCPTPAAVERAARARDVPVPAAGGALRSRGLHRASRQGVRGDRLEGLPRDQERIRDIAARSYDRDHDPAASGRQLGAITPPATGRRAAADTAPDAGDPRYRRPAGAAVGRPRDRAGDPGAELLMIEGMGHDLPAAAWPQLIGAIAQHADAADGRARGKLSRPRRPSDSVFRRWGFRLMGA